MDQSFIHLAMIWTAVLAASALARWTRLTPVLWFLAAGAVLVNVGLFPEHPDHFIEGLAELGIVVIMFAIGFEESTDNFLSSMKRSWGIAFFGGLAPFLAAFSVAMWAWVDLNIALMCGLAMTATAVSLTMVSLKGEGLHDSPAATRIMTSAVIDDIASLALVAILVPIASGQGSFSITGMALLAGKAISFFLIVTALGAWIFPNEPGKWVERLPWLSGWGIRQVLAFGGGAQATLSVLLLALLVGLAAHALGFHPAVGAYMAGLILKEEYFGGDAEQGSFHAVKRIVDNVAFSWIGPVFFVVLGARIVFDWDVFVAVIPETLVMIAALFTAQILSAGLAARFTGAMDWAGSWMIGFGMLGRAELAFVVLDIAYVQNQILSQEAFYTLMFTAFALNIAVPVTISLWKPVYTRSLSAA